MSEHSWEPSTRYCRNCGLYQNSPDTPWNCSPAPANPPPTARERAEALVREIWDSQDAPTISADDWIVTSAIIERALTAAEQRGEERMRKTMDGRLDIARRAGYEQGRKDATQHLTEAIEASRVLKPEEHG